MQWKPQRPLGPAARLPELDIFASAAGAPEPKQSQLQEETVNTGTIIGIAVGAVVVLLLIFLVARAASRRRDERHREQAGELRQQARSRSIQAKSARASADEQAAQAKRAQAEAEERAAQARQTHAAAERRAVEAEHLTESTRDQHAQARAIDPDATDSGEDEAIAINERTG